jgi:hypothetical protein
MEIMFVDAEELNQKIYMPLEDVAVFHEDGMQGTIARFLVIRYQSKCRKRWAIEKALFPRPTPEHRWAIEAIFGNEENKQVDRCTSIFFDRIQILNKNCYFPDLTFLPILLKIQI